MALFAGIGNPQPQGTTGVATFTFFSGTQLLSATDGQIQVLRSAGTNSVNNNLVLGTATSAGVCMRWETGPGVGFMLGDQSSYTFTRCAYMFFGSAGPTRWGSDADGRAVLQNNGQSQSVYLNAAQLTAGTLTAGTPYVNLQTTRFDWTNAMVVALGASTTGDVTVCTLPAKTKVVNAYIILTGAETALTGLTVALGRTSALYIDYIVASSAKAAANTVYGDASGERGTNLTGYDLPSVTGATDVKLHFISSVENLSTALGSSGTVYLETVLLP